MPNKRKITHEEYIKRVNIKYNNRYDYSLTQYQRLNSPIIIICKKHGQFIMPASRHLFQNGCSNCGREEFALRRILTTEKFIKNAIKKHGDKYDYSQTVYKDCDTKVRIKCRKHGDFYQKPSMHTSGQNCPNCAIEARHGFTRKRFINHCLQKNSDAKLYLINIFDENESFLKIGITSMHTMKYRYNRYKYEFVELFLIQGSPRIIWDLEKYLHKELKQYRYEPLKHFKGHTECYDKIYLKKIIKTLQGIDVSRI